jgi:hypothetical protein
VKEAGRTTNPDKKAFWASHIAARQELKISRTRYCRERKLSVWAMKYWEDLSAERPELPANVRPEARFVPVRMASPFRPFGGPESLDPVWVARFVRALVQG